MNMKHKGQLKRIWYQKGYEEAEKKIIEKIENMTIPESYEQVIKIEYGWASDLEFDDARIGYNQALKDILNSLKK